MREDTKQKVSSKFLEESKEPKINFEAVKGAQREESKKKLSLQRVNLQSPKKAAKKPPKRKVDPEINKLLEIIKEPTNGEGWSQPVNEKNVTFYKKTSSGSPLVLVKGMAVIEGIPLEIMWKSISDINLRSKWEEMFHSFELIDTNPDGTELIYSIMKTPFPVSGRDFVHKKTLLFDYPAKGQILLHFVSVETPKKPPTGYVRGQTIVSGYVFKEMSKFPLRCSIHIVTQVDMKGSLPSSLINMFAASGSKDWVVNYKKGCNEIMNNMKK